MKINSLKNWQPFNSFCHVANQSDLIRSLDYHLNEHFVLGLHELPSVNAENKLLLTVHMISKVHIQLLNNTINISYTVKLIN